MSSSGIPVWRSEHLAAVHFSDAGRLAERRGLEALASGATNATVAVLLAGLPDDWPTGEEAADGRVFVRVRTGEDAIRVLRANHGLTGHEILDLRRRARDARS